MSGAWVRMARMTGSGQTFRFLSLSDLSAELGGLTVARILLWHLPPEGSS